VQKKGKSYVDRFDSSVFNGEYVTGDVTETYLHQLEEHRNDTAKEFQSGFAESVIDLYNSA